jgi:hypothetical protein
LFPRLETREEYLLSTYVCYYTGVIASAIKQEKEKKDTHCRKEEVKFSL